MSQMGLSSPTPLQTATINIAAHFETEEKRHRDLNEKREAERRVLQSKLDEAKTSIRTLTDDQKRKADLMSQNQAEGLDTAKLASRISELEAQIAAETAKKENLNRELDQFAAVSQKDFLREKQMLRFLAETLQCTEAIAVDRLSDCFALLPTELVGLDDAGRPTKLRVHLGGRVHHDVTIVNSDSRFVRAFRPKSLEWLDEPARHLNHQTHERMLAYFDKASQKFLLSRTAFQWSRRGHPDWQGRVESIEEEEDFSDVAVSLDGLVKELLGTVKNEIDIEKTDSTNELAAHLQSQVMNLTTPEPQFKPCKDHLTSSAIYTRIKTDWEAFVACPWADNIKGTLALLKYHAENGERPRFWSGQFEGQYGFRLRTRDHSWIVGQVFIAESDQAPSATSPMAIRNHSFSSTLVATLGRMHLAVGGTAE